MFSIGNRIKFLREKSEITQTELSKVLKLSKSTISQYETDTNTPPDDIKIAMANYFNVSLDYLMGRTEDPTPINKNDVDILTKLEEVDFVLESVPNLALRGKVLDEETRELLKTSLAMAIQISKTQAGKNE